jgi:8-oxo-dGTP diphosphatase
MWIGASCHGSAELTRAAMAGADFALLSPWGTVPGKGPPLGSGRFASLVEDHVLPVYALGGLALHDIGNAIQGGARGIAVIRDLHQAPDPAHWLRRALEAIDSARGIH